MYSTDTERSSSDGKGISISAVPIKTQPSSSAYIGFSFVDAYTSRDIDGWFGNIVSLVEDVLRKPAAKDVPLLLLVGGFAECSLVQSAMKRNFPNKRFIILVGINQWTNICFV
jgi:hypothetical protein